MSHGNRGQCGRGCDTGRAEVLPGQTIVWSMGHIHVYSVYYNVCYIQTHSMGHIVCIIFRLIV